MRKLFPILLALFGLGAGAGAGLLMRPVQEQAVAASPCGDVASAEHADAATADDATTKEYVKLNNQFIVPVVGSGSVEALVILSLSLEVTAGSSDKVYAVEPKLRDSFLQVLFDHANAGGFAGAYTNSNNLDVLRAALLEVARKTLGGLVSDVLIVDIVRQDS